MGYPDDDIDVYMKTGISDVEDIYDYRPGGFHPVNYGDVLDGRFEVISKLGQGGYATVWLCLDISSTKSSGGDDDDGEDDDEIHEDDGDHQQKWRAVKIVRARESPAHAKDWPPLRLKRHLESLGLTPAEWEEHHVALPLEHFWIEGPNGRHLCEVGAVQGSSIADAWEVRMPADGPARIKTLLYGAGQALRFLHGHGVCHGDFTPGNVLLRVDGDALANLSRGEMLALLEERRDEPLRKTADAAGRINEPAPHGPSHVHEPVDLSSLPLKAGAVAVVDFGECWWATENGGEGRPEWSGVPVEFAAPEALYNCGVGTASDVWSFACTIVLCLTRLTMFTSDRNRAAGWYVAMLDSPMPETYRQAQAKEIRRQLDEAEGVTDEQREWAEGELEKLKLGKDSEDVELRERLVKATAVTGHDNRITALIAEERVYKNASAEEGEKTTEVVQVIPENEARILGDLLGKVFKWDPKDRIDINAVLAHEFFEDKEKPGNGSKLTPHDLLKLNSTLPPAPAPENPREEIKTGATSPDSSDHGPEEDEGVQEQPAQEQPVQESKSAAPPGQQPIPTTTPAHISGLSRIFYTVGRFLHNIRSSVIRHCKELDEWKPTKQELLKLLLGTVTVLALWYLVNSHLVATLESRRLPAEQQHHQQGCRSNTLFMPIKLKSSTSEYIQGFLAFMAPKAEDDTNSTCSCIVARGL